MSRPASFAEYKASEAASGLGGVVRTCHECHAPWDSRNGNCSNCGSLIFDEKVIEPAVFEFGPLGEIREAVGMEKSKILPLSFEDSATLKRAAEALQAAALAMSAADAVARRAVNAGLATRETIGYLQDRLDVASSTLGDFSISNLRPLMPAILGLASLIETTLATLDEETKR
jgi:hypothetical protein